MEPCPVCTEAMQYVSRGSRDVFSVECPICGKYSITRTALANLKNSDLTQRQRANICGWLRENQPYEISSTNLNNLEKIMTPSFHARADKLLIHLYEETLYVGKKIVKNRSWLGYGWCINQHELDEILSFLVSSGRISQQNATETVFIKIEPNGWSHLEELQKANSESNQGFVAIWFSDEMRKIYDEVISIGILEAGFTPHRVDQREHNDKIDDEIIAQIRKSRFVLADFTGHRGGVYFEAGFAKGLNLEVIWTCREDDLDNLHFDIRQYNCITWNQDNLDHFKSRITNRIEAVLGRGKSKE